MDSELQNTKGNHDELGRFKKGNSASRGNPHHRQVAKLRSAILNTVTEDDLAEVISALLRKAKSGEIAAIKLLFDRVLGRVGESDVAAAIERAEIELVEQQMARKSVEQEASLHERELDQKKAEFNQRMDLRRSVTS